jgi:hypothetical protein
MSEMAIPPDARCKAAESLWSMKAKFLVYRCRMNEVIPRFIAADGS